MRKPLVVLAILGLAALAACGRSTPPPTDGCTQGTSQEAYQTGMWECPDGALVFTFDTTAGRDDWLAVATKYAGTEVIGKGDTWVKVREGG